MTEAFKQWAILELMGRRRLAGMVSEQTIAGTGLIRIDIPGDDNQPESTQFYHPSALYCLTPTTEAIARQVAANFRPAPVSQWDLRPAIEATVAQGTSAYPHMDDDGDLEAMPF